ncbi:DUF2218 domain-containing protein [Maritalea mediterranea]|uniref:DUF2218 domain-containing protein n=1 Tax=Maritalea mediterranea TaxID=2909667 RepID=A0ABS9E493_9HYPH|nr:DUF2218 domain-containing protein [Maritalea mediterranea]MCF4097685.1 DUF2218 domain-containing protein [Maritalea mediterranea]
MQKSQTQFITEKGSRYLGQLCKHFAHKIDAGFEGNHGYANFPFGSAKMRADDNQLEIAIEAADEAALNRTKDVIESHLVRFAFREELEELEWRDAL